ncbi:MAG: hypothetical protein GC181_10645 [Bacteroidetes bacterium]|nr:hypothetical protein [Bacteroidota bacterium]
MNLDDKQALAKQFSNLFRKMAKEPNLHLSAKELHFGNYLARKDLMDLIHQMPKENLPDPAHLMTMENDQLIELVDNPLRIVAHFVTRWADAPIPEIEPVIPVKKDPVSKNPAPKEHPASSKSGEGKPS